MPLPEPEYISIEEAAILFKPPVTVGRVKWYISEGHLKAFLPLPRLISLYTSRNKIPRENMLDMMQATGDLRWLDDDILLYGEGIIFDGNGNEVTRDVKGEVNISEIMIRRKEIEEADKPEPATEPKKRHTFTQEQRTKTDRKGCLQYAVEAYLKNNIDGQWEGFKTFLDGKLKLPKEETLCKKQSYNFYFEKVNRNGVYLNHPKNSKTSDTHYLPKYVDGIIRTEKRNRKK